MSLGLETWAVPARRHMAFLALAGLFLAFGHAGIMLAYPLGRTATVAPFFYSFALWGIVSGLVIWGELPTALALAGITFIVVSGVALVLQDQRSERSDLQSTEAR